MKQLQSILRKAYTSPFYLWLFNRAMWRVIPFNRPHRALVISAGDDHLTVMLPYSKPNMNHLKGMHACALATLCEYTCGIGLMTKIDPEKFRIILRAIHMDYHTQARGNVTATFRTDPDMLENRITRPLQEQGMIIETFHIDAYDAHNKKICTGAVTWQLKRWDLEKKQG